MLLYMATPSDISVSESALMTVSDLHQDSSRLALECDNKSSVPWTRDDSYTYQSLQKSATEKLNSRSASQGDTCLDNKTSVTEELQNSLSSLAYMKSQFNKTEAQKELLTERAVLKSTKLKREDEVTTCNKKLELKNSQAENTDFIEESHSNEGESSTEGVENNSLNSVSSEAKFPKILSVEKDSNENAFSRYKKQIASNSKARKLLLPKLRKFSFKNLIRKSTSIPNLHKPDIKNDAEKKYSLDSEFNTRRNILDDGGKYFSEKRLVKYSSESQLNVLCSDSGWPEFGRRSQDDSSYTTFCLIKDSCDHSKTQVFNQNTSPVICDNASSSNLQTQLSNADRSQTKPSGKSVFYKPWKRIISSTPKPKETPICNTDQKSTPLIKSDPSESVSSVFDADRNFLVNNRLNSVHLQRQNVLTEIVPVNPQESSSVTLKEDKPSGRVIFHPKTYTKKTSVDITLSRSPSDLIKQLTSNCRDLRTSKSSSDLSSTSSDSSYQSSDSCSSSGSRFILKQCRIGSGVAFGLVQVPSPPNGNGYSDGQGLVTIRMKPDDHGRFGFNVKGGADQGMPIIVSRVAPNTPADLAIPRLNEGDQVLFINGRDVSQHTHEQVVMFIRASRETHSGELVLVVRPNVYVGEDPLDEPDFMYIPETHQITSSAGANALEASLILLQESLESGAALAQFDQLYRKKPNMTMNSARQEKNVAKNRYRDISPYDQTRVILKSGEDGDYINGNFVNMEIPQSGILNRYIAAQGPLPNTCTDFWEMIWEQQCSLVVMLTTKVERGRVKCHQYWPELYETADFGKLQITCLKEEETPSFAFREFNITHVNTNEERHVSHMQYIAWPDHGVPDDPSDFLDFVMKVRQRRSGMGEPTVVHCSAGIGRTGVLITMETAMCLIEANQPVYPLALVRQMRDQRAMLIQTASQYKFVCEAILRVYHDGIVKPLEDFMNQR